MKTIYLIAILCSHLTGKENLSCRKDLKFCLEVRNRVASIEEYDNSNEDPRVLAREAERQKLKHEQSPGEESRLEQCADDYFVAPVKNDEDPEEAYWPRVELPTPTAPIPGIVSERFIRRL